MEDTSTNPNTEEVSTSSWWSSWYDTATQSSWYDTAKQKLSETNQFMMRDMKEFTQVVKNDASKLVASTASTMKDQLNINMDEASEATKVVTNSLSNFLGKVVKQVTPQLPDSDENEDSSLMMGTTSGVKMMSPAQARLYHLQTNPGTYCNQPDDNPEYDEWLKDFRLDQKKEEISLLMLDSKEIRSLYTKLVPEAVSHVDFWTRYFYNLHLHDKAEKRREMLVKRAESGHKSAEISWEDDDDDDDDDFIDESSPPPPTAAGDVATLLHDITTSLDIISSDSQVSSAAAPLAIDDVNTTTQVNDVIGDVIVKVTDDINVTVQERDNATCADVTVHDGTSDTTRTDDVMPASNNDVNVVPASPTKTDNTKDDITIPSTGTDNVIITNVATTANNSLANFDDVVASDDVSDDVITSNDVTKVSKGELEAEKNEADDGICDVATKPADKQQKEPSSGDSSDWEKEFELDMTEDEIQQALSRDDPLEGDDWESWE